MTSGLRLKIALTLGSNDWSTNAHAKDPTRFVDVTMGTNANPFDCAPLIWHIQFCCGSIIAGENALSFAFRFV